MSNSEIIDSSTGFIQTQYLPPSGANVSSLNTQIGPLTITGAGGLTVGSTGPGNIQLTQAPVTAVTTLNTQSGALTITGINGLTVGTTGPGNIQLSQGAVTAVTTLNTQSGALAITGNATPYGGVTIGSTGAGNISITQAPPTITMIDDFFVGGPLTATTPLGGAITPLTAYAPITAGKKYMITCNAYLTSTGTTGTMNISLQFQGFAGLLELSEVPCSTTSIYESSAIVIQIPAPVTTYRFVVSGGSIGAGNSVTATTRNVTIQQLD